MKSIPYSANFFSTIGVFVWIFGFISGIVAGNTYKVLVEDYIGFEAVFNFRLMFVTWVSAVIIGTIFFFFANATSHYDNYFEHNKSYNREGN